VPATLRVGAPPERGSLVLRRVCDIAAAGPGPLRWHSECSTIGQGEKRPTRALPDLRQLGYQRGILPS
jgi:hypothetical protein